MNNKLEIKRTKEEILLELELKGRLDAYSSGLLSQEIEQEIRSGNYDINLNMLGIKYISSAGIRVLVKYYKELKTFKGQLTISDISDEARSVLEMVGLHDLLSKKGKRHDGDIGEEKSFSGNGMVYTRSKLRDEQKLTGWFYGDPKCIQNSKIIEKALIKEKFSAGKYGIGFGAFGHSFDDCKYRFGEFIGIGDSLVYLPSDGSNIPDYSLKTGKLVPEINMLHGIIFEGRFSENFQFKPGKQARSISMSNLIKDISSFDKYKTAAYVMIAETSGLVGTYFLKSPAMLNEGNSPFSFPGIRNNISFTTEPEYNNMLTITVGIAVKEPGEDIKQFLRPLSNNSDIHGHFHSAVFTYHPIGKNITDINETTINLFENEKLQQVLHLINDNRINSGIGESEFIHGNCWISELDIKSKTIGGSL